MKMKILAILIFVGLIVMTCGCVETEEEGGVTVEETANVGVQVTDKVTEDFDHVNVTFSEVKLHRQTENDSEAWEIITSDPKTVDLIYLNLSNLNETLGVAEIPVGNYTKLWINVSKAVGVLNSTGEEVNITVPSGWLKIQQLHLFNVTKGNHTITVDLDLESSIHTFHGGQEYKFVPVISKMKHHHEKELKFQENDKSKIRNMVGNRAPAIDITVNDTVVKNKVTVDADVNYTFNASATWDLDGDTLNFTWDFDDGTTANTSVVIHKFADSNQPYNVTLTVSDGTNEVTETFKVHISKTTGE
jgi:hypothetical protein